jgi:hypothetical protein
MTTPWQEYKKKLGDTRPWDMVNPNIKHLPEEESAKRYAVCESCPSLLKLTHQCKECGCFMKLKVKLPAATCPLGKW